MASGKPIKYAERRFGRISRRSTSCLPVGRIGPQTGDPPGTDGWQIIGLPWTEKMRGMFTPVDVEYQDDKGRPAVTKMAFTKLGIRNLKGLRKKPIEGWEGNYSDFPEGTYTFLALKRAYGGSGDAALLIESSVEMSDDEEERPGERPRKISPASNVLTASAKPSDKGREAADPGEGERMSAAYREAARRRKEAENEAKQAAAEAAAREAEARVQKAGSSGDVAVRVKIEERGEADDRRVRDELVDSVLERAERTEGARRSSGSPSTPSFGMGAMRGKDDPDEPGWEEAPLLRLEGGPGLLALQDRPAPARAVRVPSGPATPRAPPGASPLPAGPPAPFTRSRSSEDEKRFENDRQLAFGLGAQRIGRSCRVTWRSQPLAAGRAYGPGCE